MLSLKKFPLPPEWEVKFDFTTNRNFFVNHKTKTTTWQDPRLQIYKKEIEQERGIGREDFLEDEGKLKDIIKQTEREYEIEIEIKKLQKKFSSVSLEHIREVYERAHGNVSNTEVMLRQESRKTTNSELRSSSSSSDKLNSGSNKRFSLSERSTYNVPESSKERIRFQMRSEFADIDSRIVDRVLETTDYIVEKSRAILKVHQNECKHDKSPVAADSLKNFEEYEKYKFEDYPIESKMKETMINENNAKTSFLSNFKSGVRKPCDEKAMYKSGRAAGANPDNFHGAQIKKK